MYKIKDTCVCCHNCAMECPTGAIDYNGPKYEIDPDKCVECGLCEKLCHTCSIVDDKQSPPVERHGKIVKNCDVVVCGGGTGLIAAVRAAREGKRVILIEKSKKLGGNTDYAHMFFPVYTTLHKRAGLADLREEAVDVFWNRSKQRLDRELVRSAVYGCGDFFDFLCTLPETEEAFELHRMDGIAAFGPMYSNGIIHYPQRLYDNLLCRDQAIGPGWGGTFIKYRMLEAIGDQKLWVEIITGCRAGHLLTDADGAVTGVFAEDEGGEVEIHAGAVILATGGMGRSDEKLQRYFNFFNCETPIHRFSVPGDTGDAIDMLQDLGVRPPEDRMFVSIFGPAHHPFSYCLFRVCEHPNCLSVNLNGRRWHNEAEGLMGGRFEIAKQPKEVAWAIFDEQGMKQIIDAYHTDPKFRDEWWIYEHYQEDLEQELALPNAPARKADTLEDLARQIGLPVPAFLETVKNYNRFCAEGRDEEFAKPPESLRPLGQNGPYYAFFGQRFSEGAFGGLRVNGKCEVLRENGEVIPGLYGVGDATSAMHIRDELAVISELTWATASAWLSGKNASDYLR